MATGRESSAEWMVLINPMAGAAEGSVDWERISPLLTRYGISFRHRFTEHARHAISLIHEGLSMGYHKYVMVGGDGFLSEAVNAIFTQESVDPDLVTLALIPLGTGNDWARTFNIPSAHEEAIQILAKGKVLRHDPAMAREITKW